MPGTICAAVRMPPAVTLTVPIPPTPPERVADEDALAGEIDHRRRARTAGYTSPDWLTSAAARSAEESASVKAMTAGSQRKLAMRRE